MAENSADSGPPGGVNSVATAADAADGKEMSIGDLIDEMLGIDLATLTKCLAVSLCVLFLLGGYFLFHAVKNGRTELALLYGGFLFLIVGLVASVLYVVREASRLQETPSGNTETSRLKAD